MVLWGGARARQALGVKRTLSACEHQKGRQKQHSSSATAPGLNWTLELLRAECFHFPPSPPSWTSRITLFGRPCPFLSHMQSSECLSLGVSRAHALPPLPFVCSRQPHHSPGLTQPKPLLQPTNAQSCVCFSARRANPRYGPPPRSWICQGACREHSYRALRPRGHVR